MRFGYNKDHDSRIVSVANGLETRSVDAAMELNATIFEDQELLKLMQDAGVRLDRLTLNGI